MSAPETRTFGGWLLIGVDALIYASLVFITIYVRRGVDWPGVTPAVSLLLPSLAALAALSAVFVPRPIAALVAAVLLGVAMRNAWADGLTFSGSRFGAMFFGFAGFWLLHLVAGAAFGLRRGPWPRRFLLVQGVAGAALMAVVLL